MKHFLLILLSFSLPFHCLSQGTGNNDLEKLVREEGQVEVSLINAGNNLKKLSGNVSVTKITGDKIFIRLSPLTVRWFADQNFEYDLVEKTRIDLNFSSRSVSAALQWNSYPTYSQYLEIMKRFTAEYSDMCRLDTIGTSINGKLVLALKISDNPETDEDEPGVFYTSTMHGDETAGFVLMLRLAEYILSRYDTKNEIREIVDELEIWINPLANPDGTYRNGDEITDPVRFNSNGYDLNRNFPDPSQPYGNGNIMQKETADMIKFLKKHSFVLSANFHSGAEVVNYPWDSFLYGIRNRIHADDNWFYEISRAFADTVHLYSPPEYMGSFENGVTRGVDWYSIKGGRQDYVTWELHGREVTIELDYFDDYPYVTPPGELDLLWEYNYRSLIGYIRNALYGIKGKVSNSLTAEPVAAKITINGHDEDSSYVYSGGSDGSYTRLIYNGIYDVSFSAPGFKDTTVTAVSVNRFERTLLDISMEPFLKSGSSVPLLFPNPVVSELKALLPPGVIGRINIKIYNISGMPVTDYYDIKNNSAPLNISVSGLSNGFYTIVFTDNEGHSAEGKFVINRN